MIKLCYTVSNMILNESVTKDIIPDVVDRAFQLSIIIFFFCISHDFLFRKEIRYLMRKVISKQKKKKNGFIIGKRRMFYG